MSMGILFIAVGILLVGYFIISRGTSQPAVTSSGSYSKFVFGGIGVGCFLMAAYLLYSTGDVWEVSHWQGFVYVIFSLALVIGGSHLCKAAYDADQKEAQNADARMKAATSRTEQQLLDARRETESAKLKHERTQVGVREHLAGTAKQKGLDIDSVINVNTTRELGDIDLDNHANRTSIDLQAYAKEKDIDLNVKARQDELENRKESDTARIQLDAADRIEHYRIVSQLEEDLEELMTKRRKIELKEKDAVLKGQKLARLDIRIANLEQDIDGRQNRLLSTSDGQETKRLS